MLALILVVVSVALFVVGWCAEEPVLALSGAVAFLLYEVVDRAKALLMSARHRSTSAAMTGGKAEDWKAAAEGALRGATQVAGAFALLSGSNSDKPWLAWAGGLIWIGWIVVYFLSGVVFEWLTGVPLWLSYGGWKVDRYRLRRESRKHGCRSHRR